MKRDPELNILPNLNAYTFLHMRLGQGMVTCAIRWSPDDEEELEVGVSFCSPKDQFVKRKGRDIAESRLLKYGRRNKFAFIPDPEFRIKSQVHDLIREAAETRPGFRAENMLMVEFPGWVNR
jgi:hypothetical protein